MYTRLLIGFLIGSKALLIVYVSITILLTPAGTSAVKQAHLLAVSTATIASIMRRALYH